LNFSQFLADFLKSELRRNGWLGGARRTTCAQKLIGCRASSEHYFRFLVSIKRRLYVRIRVSPFWVQSYVVHTDALNFFWVSLTVSKCIS